MSVIRHQTPRENVDAEAVQFLGRDIEVGASIIYGLENGNGSYAALSDVMQITGRYNPGNASHA